MSTPYYQDESEGRACECSCGEQVHGTTRRGPLRFVTGHNLRTLERTEAHRRAISESCREAWATKRQRMPLGDLVALLNGNRDHLEVS